ncbi:MAG TPA: potassium channel family protein [Jatrophihabitans sp.]
MTAPDGTEPTRLERWQDSTEWPMAALAVLFLAVYATEVLAVGLNQTWHTTLRVADYTIWALFVIEFGIRLSLTTRRGRYLVRHLTDVAMLALPFLRTLRVLRLVPLLRALNRWVADSLRGKVVVYGSITAVLLVFTGALAELDAERNQPGASITTFGTALWWTSVTICTVGYGDYTPITAQGRLVAVGVMIGGVMLVGAVTASFATWLIDRLRIEEEVEQAATQADLRDVHTQLQGVQHELAELKTLLRERQGADRPAAIASE